MIPYVFVINLPHRTDRRQNMEDLLKALGITEYEFVEPIQPSTSNLKHSMGIVTKNELSLMLTVDHIFDKAQAMGLYRFLVFEDDVMTTMSPKEVVKRMELALSRLPSDDKWDMLYFEYCFETCEFLTEYNDYLYQAASPLCAASIVYNARSINKLRTCLRTTKHNLDNSWSKCVQKEKLNAFLVNPPLFTQDNAFSTNIQIKPSTYIKSLFIDFNDYPDTHKSLKPVCKSDILNNNHIKFINIVFALMALTIVSFIICCAIDKYNDSKTTYSQR